MSKFNNLFGIWNVLAHGFGAGAAIVAGFITGAGHPGPGFLLACVSVWVLYATYCNRGAR